MEQRNCKNEIISKADERTLNGSISIIVIKHVLAYGSGELLISDYGVLSLVCSVLSTIASKGYRLDFDQT